ncbi:MAG: DUF4276 family protein [Burkholderiales bacterium]|nr:DUF4276 family protein [Burkholderiales bacterium]
MRDVLAGHLSQRGYQSVAARIFGNARQRDRRGGIRSWDSARQDIVRHLKQDRGCIVTTMIDYYGMPPSGNRAWPGRLDSSQLAHANKAPHVEKALREAVRAAMSDDFDDARFVPFVVMHEFEGLLFSACDALAAATGRRELAGAFAAIRAQFGSPEEINDGIVTAPSKRIIEICPSYQKPIAGIAAAKTIGLSALREHCPHFNSWVSKLEAAA